MKCARCGIDTPRLTLGQRYCPQCKWEVDAKYGPKPTWMPLWRRVSQPKDMTGSAA